MRPAGAAARAALCVVFPIGLFYVLVSRANRSVQDVLFRTSVVYDWGSHRPGTDGRERIEIVDVPLPTADGGAGRADGHRSMNAAASSGLGDARTRRPPEE